MSSRRTALMLALGTGAVLAAMIVVAVTTGASQEMHEYVRRPDVYAKSLLEHAGGLRLLLAFDLAFLVLYTGLFAALADYLAKLGRPFTRLALIAIVGTAVLDMVENHWILSSLEMAENGQLPSEDWLGLQQVISGTKFAVSYLALFMFGVAIPRTSKLAIALALFLTVGTLATAVITHGVPPSMRASVDPMRWIGFLVGFVLAALWLRTAPEPD